MGQHLRWFLPCVLAILLLAPRAVSAQSLLQPGMAATSKKKKTIWDRAPWRGSAVTLRNAVSVPSFDKSSSLTYNPFWAMTLAFRAHWWFTDTFYGQARFSLSREMTNSDITSDQGEVWPSDVAVRIGAANFYKIPVLDIVASADLDVIAPTSPVSRARTMVLGLAPALELTRRFSLLKGLAVGYRFRAAKSFNRFTTAEREVPLISGCSQTAVGCSEFLNTGVRNHSWRLSNTLYAMQMFTSWLGFSVGASLINDFLYDASEDPQVNLAPVEPQNQRFFVATDISAFAIPFRSIVLRVGASTFNAQQKPDSSVRAPFFNRFTQIYFDVGINIAGLIAQLREG